MARARVFSLARSFARPRAAPRFAVDRAIDDVDNDVVETRVTPPLWMGSASTHRPSRSACVYTHRRRRVPRVPRVDVGRARARARARAHARVLETVSRRGAIERDVGASSARVALKRATVSREMDARERLTGARARGRRSLASPWSSPR